MTDATRRPSAVDISGLARRFGQRWILRGLDLRIEPGEAVALVGHNGSGKTTLLRVISTSLRPHRGAVTIYGHDVTRDGDSVRALLGVLGHAPGLYDDLTAEENLRFAMKMAGGREDIPRIRETLAEVGLAAHVHDRARGFSSGMRRRLGLAKLLIRPPRLLLLDEPYAAFDQDGIVKVNEFVRRVTAAGGAALIATHDLVRTHGYIDRVVRMQDGRLSAASVPESRAAAAALEVVEGGAA